MSVHKAAPGDATLDNPANPTCDTCKAAIKLVLGGHGPTWVHTDTGAVAAPTPDVVPVIVRVLVDVPVDAWNLSYGDGETPEEIARATRQHVVELVRGSRLLVEEMGANVTDVTDDPIRRPPGGDPMTAPDLSSVDWSDLLIELRRRGTAVVAYAADEIGSVDSDEVEDVMRNAGGEFIADHVTEG